MASAALEKPYFSEKVKEAIANSASTKTAFEDAIVALKKSQKKQDELFENRKLAANEKLASVLEKLEELRKDLAEKKKSVLGTALGAEEQLRWAKNVKHLSKEKRKEFENAKANLETIRYLALARYILAKPDSFEQSVSQSLLDEDQESSDDYKNRIIQLAQQLEQERAMYEDEVAEAEVREYNLSQIANAIKDVEKVVAENATSGSEQLQRLRLELQQYRDLQESLQQLKKSRNTITLRLQMQATAQTLFQLVETRRNDSQALLLTRLAKTLNSEYALKEEKTAEEATALRESLEAIEEQQKEIAEANAKHIEENQSVVSQLENQLASAQELFTKAESALKKELPEESVFTLWPQTLQGDLKQFEEQIVGAMKKFDIAKLKLEDATPDEIDLATGKYKSCLSESLSLSEYQRALMHYVNDNFSVLPGVLLIWEPGTGKTLGSTSACVENLRLRYIEKNGKPMSKQPIPANAVDVLILGFTDDNLNDFRNTFFKALERDLKGQYELGKSFGEEASQIDQIILKGKDGTQRTARVMTQRYSVGGAKAADVKMHPDGIMLVDEAHFMVTREVPTSSTNYKQVVATVEAWEKVVLNFNGVKLILTATPSGANRDPTKMFELLKYLSKERGEKKDNRNVEAWKKWFKPRKDGNGVEWVNEDAKKEYEQDWLRARVSYVSLRFDRRVFPQIETKCGGKDDKQCVFQVEDNGTLTLAAERPTLSEQEIEAREMLEYGRMAPLLVQVPLTLQEAIDFATKAKAAATSANTRNPEVVDCAASKTPLSDQTDEEVAQCANYAHYGHKDVLRGGKYASGGGFDFKTKVAASHKIIDTIAKKNPTRHLIIASGYEKASTQYFQTDSIAEFKDFDQILQKDVASDETVINFMKNAKKKRRIALLTGTTWSGSSQTKTAKQKQLIKQIFFSDANADGSLIEILIVDASMLTGFDAKGATHLHIFSPVKNQQQAWSRILRRCAQPVAKSTVYVYTYKTFVPDTVKSNPKNKILITPDEMILEAMRRKRLQVQAIDLLMQEMIKDSYDRYWFAEYSSGGQQKIAVVKDGAPPVLPLTQQEYILWRLFSDQDVKDDTFDDKNSVFGKPIGAAAAAQALAQKKENPSKFNQVAKLIAERARKAASRFFYKKNKEIAPPLPNDLDLPQLPETNAILNDIYQFARDFYIGKPWIAADSTRFTKDQKPTSILSSLLTLVDMNLLIDLSLITAFIEENLSASRQQQILDLLDAKAAVTPPALMRTFEEFYLLQEVANVHYRDVVQNTVALHEARSDAVKDLIEAADEMKMPPPLPPMSTTPLMSANQSTANSPSGSSDDSAPSSPGSPNILPFKSGLDSTEIDDTSDFSAIQKDLLNSPVSVETAASPTSSNYYSPALSVKSSQVGSLKNAQLGSSQKKPDSVPIDNGQTITYPLLNAPATALAKVSYPFV